jgi:hypothetical protein
MMSRLLLSSSVMNRTLWIECKAPGIQCSGVTLQSIRDVETPSTLAANTG